MPRISNSIRQRIVEDVLTGKSYREVANQFQCSHSAVQKLYNKFLKTSSIENLLKTGRPKTTSPRENRKLIRLSRINPKWTSKKLKANWGCGNMVSVSTVKRILNRAKLFGRVAARKPLLSMVHKNKRLSWCKSYDGWSNADWNKIIFTDESMIQLYQNKKQYVWRPKNTRYSDFFTSKTVKHGYKSLMIWGAIRHDGSRILVKCPKPLDSDGYMKIIKDEFIPFYNPGEILMQDNAPIHRADKVIDFIGNSGIIYIDDWPAQSPDMNIIENMWHILKENVSRHNPKNIEDLWNICLTEWNAIPNDYVRKLYDSIPYRLKLVKKNRGCCTKY